MELPQVTWKALPSPPGTEDGAGELLPTSPHLWVLWRVSVENTVCDAIPNVYHVIHWKSLRPRLPCLNSLLGDSAKTGQLKKYLPGAHTKVLVETGLPHPTVAVTVCTELHTGDRDMPLSEMAQNWRSCQTVLLFVHLLGGTEERTKHRGSPGHALALP